MYAFTFGAQHDGAIHFVVERIVVLGRTFVEANNPQSLVLTIQELASNPARRSEYGGRALERARRFNSDKMAEEYLGHYRTLVSAEVAAA